MQRKMIEEAGIKFQLEAEHTSNRIWLKEMKDNYADVTHDMAT